MENVDSIISENFKIAENKKTDNHWLGHGVYFYDDYELAEWWAETKVKAHFRKYGKMSSASVIRAQICAQNILNLDNPFEMNKFAGYCEELEKDIVEMGIVLDFVMEEVSELNRGKIKQRERCFWMDQVKNAKNIEVII